MIDNDLATNFWRNVNKGIVWKEKKKVYPRFTSYKPDCRFHVYRNGSRNSVDFFAPYPNYFDGQGRILFFGTGGEIPDGNLDKFFYNPELSPRPERYYKPGHFIPDLTNE
jgi:hypothetical protein